MTTTTAKAVREVLKGVLDPELRRSLVDLGMVRGIRVDGGTVRVELALTTPDCPLKDQIAGDTRRAVLTLPGVAEVNVAFTSMTRDERERALGTKTATVPRESVVKSMRQVGRVVAVMSGKGGVGKSLVAGLLAVALAREGRRVGILDADLTGPSVPKMFGLRGPLQMGPIGIIPARTELGIAVMSMHFLLEREDAPLIWRGPLVAGAIKQFWDEVVWGDLDYLIVDLPPGTSDAPLTVMQSLPVAGAVIVSSPQDLAGMIVRKAVGMAKQMNVPILGVVENMSYFVCPDTGIQHSIFGPSRGQELAEAACAPLLACLPLDPEIARLCDLGRIEEYDSEEYRQLARAFAVNCPTATGVA